LAGGESEKFPAEGAKTLTGDKRKRNEKVKFVMWGKADRKAGRRGCLGKTWGRSPLMGGEKNQRIEEKLGPSPKAFKGGGSGDIHVTPARG